MSRRTGIVVIDRLKLLRDHENSHGAPMRAPSIEGSHEEICRRYRGFDGFLWPELEHRDFATEDGLADLKDLDEVDAYLMKLPSRSDCDIVVLSRDDAARLRDPQWNHIGFDIGYFDSEWSRFSVIMNEVIYGTVPELRQFANELNKQLLFDNLECAHLLMKEREKVAALGADVEKAECIEPIAIFVRRP